MVRQIITPTAPLVTLHLPDTMVGKTVELIAFEIQPEPIHQTTGTEEERLKKIEALTNDSLVDLSHFHFNRNQANNYDE